jgi:hypothetical protein
MKGVHLVALGMTGLLVHGLLSWAGGPSKYNACGLLTAAELKAAVNANVDKADDRDVVIPSGPYRGETMSTCSWAMGATFANLNVIRGPQTTEQKSAGLSELRTIEAGLMKQGWTVQAANIPGADCNAYKPPAGENGMRPFASCIMQSKGLGFWLGVGGATTLTPQQVKDLADKVAARLP